MKEQPIWQLSFGSKGETQQYIKLKKELQANVYAVQQDITKEAKMLEKVMVQIETFSNSIQPKFKQVVEKAENLLGRLHFFGQFKQELKQFKAAKTRLAQQHKLSYSIIKSAVNSHQFLSENQLSNLKRIMRVSLSHQMIIPKIEYFIVWEQGQIRYKKEHLLRNKIQLPQSQKMIFDWKISQFQRQIQIYKAYLKHLQNFSQSNDSHWFKEQNEQFAGYKSKLSQKVKTHNTSILPKDQTLKGKPETQKLSYGIQTNNSFQDLTKTQNPPSQTSIIQEQKQNKDEQDQMIQNQFENDDLATIQSNIKLDYPGQYSAKNIQNVLEIYQKAYQFNSFEIRNETYWKQKKKMQMQMQKQKQTQTQKFSVQLKILKWMEQYRATAIKFDGTQIPGSNLTYGLNNSSTQSQKIVIPQQFIFCQNTYFLKCCRFKQIKQLQGDQRYKRWKKKDSVERKYQKREIMMNKGKQDSKMKEIILKMAQIQNRYYLQQKDNKKSSDAKWVGEMTQDGRIIWRASIKIDKQDVEKLLRYLLTQTQDLEECPSIVINTGSHGDQFGQNVQQGSDATLIDQRIVREMYQIIQQLLFQGQNYAEIKDHKFNKNEKILCQKMLINQKNIKHKILINSLKIQKGGEYPYQADHIIDTQCKGASTLVKKQFLYSIQHIKKPFLECTDLIFNFNQKEEMMQRFNASKIIKNNSIQKKLKTLFSSQILNAQLLFNSQLFSRRRYTFMEQVFSQNNLLIIIKTENNQVIGAYSPLPHSILKYDYRNKKNPNLYFNQQGGIYVRDPSRKSFLFSLTQTQNQTQNYKFELNDTNRAIIISQYSPYMTFGNNQFVFTPHPRQFCQFNVCDSKWNDRAYDCECLNKQFQKYQQENINQPNKMTRQQYYYDKILGKAMSAKFKPKYWQIWKITQGQQLNKDVNPNEQSQQN